MSHAFKDSRGVAHDVIINFASIFRVASVTGFDLLNPGSEQDGVILSDRLLSDPNTLIKVVHALCASDEKEEDFYAAIDGKAYAEAENAFWGEYSDFFAQAGRDWLVVAISKSLETKRQAEEVVKEKLLSSKSPTYSVSLSSPDAKAAGSTKQSGNSQDSPTPAPVKKRPTERKSSAPSTTRTSRDDKTSEAHATSTLTSEPRQKPKRKSS